MPKRMTDTEIWEEDWFIDLPLDYKLFFLYIKDKCDHSGMWRPNRRKFQMLTGGKMIMYDDFLDKVNTDPENREKKKQRIIVLEGGKWFLTRFIPFQLGGRFVIGIGAHRGALKLLVTNGVHPKDVPGIDWCGMESIDFEDLKNIVYGKGLYRLSVGDTKAMLRDKERERDPVQRKELEKGGVGEKTNEPSATFKLQELYDTPWERINILDRDTLNINEQQFIRWKKFVDFLVERNYTDLFKAIFVNPADFTTLVATHGFTEDKWDTVVRKMLSTGIKPEQNLYFRIPDFMKYAGKGGKGDSAQVSAGEVNYDNMEKW